MFLVCFSVMKLYPIILFLVLSSQICPAEDRGTAGIAPLSKNGAIVAAYKLKYPLQIISPIAGPEYGDGRDFVSWSDCGKPKGIMLLKVEL